MDAAEALNPPVDRTDGAEPADGLTRREREILAEMAQGKSNAAIASSLVLSTRAVEKHTNSIFSKLGLSEEIDVSRARKALERADASDPEGVAAAKRAQARLRAAGEAE